MKNNEIMVSVIVATYNHEKYIEQAIRSVMAQEVDFEYEVLIGEDCSPDGTAEVLRTLEPELPKNYHIFYREKNLGIVGNFLDLFQRSKGKYMIILEGDDYWIYYKKLQKQVDFLEVHNDYIAVAHNKLTVDKNNNIIEQNFLECKKQEYTLVDWREGFFPGQTTTILFRNYYRDNLFQEVPSGLLALGDVGRNFLFGSYGKVKCIQEKWTAYRYVVDEGTSFTATLVKDKAYHYRQYVNYRDVKKYADTVVKTKDAMMAAETVYLVHYLRAVKYKANPNLTYFTWMKEFWNAEYKMSYIAHRINRIKFRALRRFR